MADATDQIVKDLIAGRNQLQPGYKASELWVTVVTLLPWLAQQFGFDPSMVADTEPGEQSRLSAGTAGVTCHWRLPGRMWSGGLP
jgi:hypothetical protein